MRNADGGFVKITAGTVPSLKPFQETTVQLSCGNIFKKGAYELKIIINPDAQYPATLKRRKTPCLRNKLIDSDFQAEPEAIFCIYPIADRLVYRDWFLSSRVMSVLIHWCR